MTCEEGVLAIEGNWADQVLDGVAIDLDAAVGEEGLEPMPMIGDIGVAYGWGRNSTLSDLWLLRPVSHFVPYTRLC